MNDQLKQFIAEPKFEMPISGKTVIQPTIYRQNYAVREFTDRMREAVKMHQATDIERPEAVVRKGITDAFFVKELMLHAPDEVEERQAKSKLTGDHVTAYLRETTQNGPYNEDMGQIERLRLKMLEKRAPMPQNLKRDLQRVMDRCDAIEKEKKNRALMENQLSAVTSNRKKDEIEPEIELTDAEKQFLEGEKAHRLRKFKDPRFYNDPKIKNKIEPGMQVFKREVRKDVIRQGYTKLLEKMEETNLTLRQIKNGQTLFDKEVMKTNYDNPYFVNQKMRHTLCSFLETTTPGIKGNDNIMVEDEKRFPNKQVKDYAAKRGVKKPLQVMAQQIGGYDIYANQQLQLTTDGKSTRGLDGFSTAQTRHDSLAQDTTGFNHTQQSFGPGITDMSAFTTGTHNTAQGRTRNVMMTSFNTTVESSKNFGMPKQSVSTFGGSPSEASPFGQSKGSMQTRVRNYSMKNQQYQTASPKKDDKAPAIPFMYPYQLMKRNDGTGFMNGLNMPCSPAFVNDYKKKTAINLKETIKHCHEKNIPFCSEEDKFYRIKQLRQRFDKFKTSLNHCFETQVPTQFENGMRLLTDHPKRSQQINLTEDFCDPRLYFPQVAECARGHQKKSIQNKNKEESTLRNMTTIANTQTDKNDAGFVPPIDNQLNALLSNEDGLTLQKLRRTNRDAKAVHQIVRQQQKKILSSLESKLCQPIIVGDIEDDPATAKLAEERKKVQEATQTPQDKKDEPTEEEVLAKLSESMQKSAEKEGQLFQLFKKVPASKRRGDPIKNILRVNKKAVMFSKKMNEKLLKIIERVVELDRPILMHDKLDIIWDKEPSLPKPPATAEPLSPIQSIFNPGEGSALTSKNPLQKGFVRRMNVGRQDSTKKDSDNKAYSSRVSDSCYQSSQARVQIASSVKAPGSDKHDTDNVNHYAVHSQLKLRKIEREQINLKQIAAYQKLLEYIESRKAHFSEQNREYVPFFPIDERERAFMDALRVILQSGYFLSPSDFRDMLGILREIVNPEPVQTQQNVSILQGTSFLTPQTCQPQRIESEKKKAKLINFLVLACNELGFFETATEDELIAFLDQTLYPPQDLQQQFSSILMHGADITGIDEFTAQDDDEDDDLLQLEGIKKSKATSSGIVSTTAQKWMNNMEHVK